jgi:hypothetical protein
MMNSSMAMAIRTTSGTRLVKLLIVMIAIMKYGRLVSILLSILANFLCFFLFYSVCDKGCAYFVLLVVDRVAELAHRLVVLAHLL